MQLVQSYKALIDCLFKKLLLRQALRLSRFSQKKTHSAQPRSELSRRRDLMLSPSNYVATGVFLPLITCALARAQVPQFHPPEPGVNLGDTSFLDGVAGPGWLAEQIGDVYHATEIADSSGRTTNAVPAINAITGLTHIAWLSNRQIFHAWYGAEVLVLSGYVHAGNQGSAAGLADLIVSPLNLQWKEWKIGRVRMQQRVVFDFFLPTGEYQRSSPVNLSSHTFEVNPYYAITVFPAKRWETSWRIHYLWNSVNHSPPLATGLRSTQAGQAVFFCATLARELPHRIWFGANGYYLKQITNPSVNGVQLADSPEQVGAIGPGAMWDLGHFFLYANFYHEVGAVNRPQGDKLVLRVSWLPNRKVSHAKAN
jgi:hypothetical protein